MKNIIKTIPIVAGFLFANPIFGQEKKDNYHIDSMNYRNILLKSLQTETQDKRILDSIMQNADKQIGWANEYITLRLEGKDTLKQKILDSSLQKALMDNLGYGMISYHVNNFLSAIYGQGYGTLTYEQEKQFLIDKETLRKKGNEYFTKRKNEFLQYVEKKAAEGKIPIDSMINGQSMVDLFMSIYTCTNKDFEPFEEAISIFYINEPTRYYKQKSIDKFINLLSKEIDRDNNTKINDNIYGLLPIFERSLRSGKIKTYQEYFSGFIENINRYGYFENHKDKEIISTSPTDGQ